MSQTLTLYKMRYTVPIINDVNCSLEDAFEIQREEYDSGLSCCQIIIDEENKIIYSLNDRSYKSENFKYNLVGTYKVYNTDYFDAGMNLTVLGNVFTKN